MLYNGNQTQLESVKLKELQYMQLDLMEDNTDVIQTINTDGPMQELREEGDLDLKNTHFNFYTMNTKWETTIGPLQTNIWTQLDTLAVNLKFLDIYTLTSYLHTL